MPKGQVITLQFQDSVDEATRAIVTRLTPPDVTCHRTYFYQKCFTCDGQHLLFGAWFDGDWNCYLLDLQNQTARQLTEGPGDNTFGCFLSPDDRLMYYVKGGRELRRVHLESLHEDVVYVVPEGYTGYGTWVANSDCTRMVGIEVVSEDLLPLSSWEQFHEQFHRRPRSRIVIIDLASGQGKVIHEEARWLGHPMYRPLDDQTVAFCHEGPHDLVRTRMWLMNEDGSNLRPVKQQDEGESCTHEFWVPDGSRMIYVSYRKGIQDRFICAADPITLENQELMTMPPCSHLMSNFNGTQLVGDGSDTPADVDAESAFELENDPFLYHFDLKSGQTRRIAQHGTSWKVHLNNRQVTHPHPSFTPDERQVLFTSDKDGEPAVYLVTLPWQQQADL